MGTLVLLLKLERGIEEAEEDLGIPDAEARKLIAKWRE